MTFYKIQTDRLLLRRWRDADREPFAAICADPAVMKFIGNGQPKSAAEASADIEKFEAEWEREGFGLFALELRETGDLAGFTGLSVPTFLPEIMPSVEIGWRLARNLWGQGLATEAAQAVLAFGLGILGIPGIVSICHVENESSRRVMKRIGLTFDRRTVVPMLECEVDVFRTA
ncbi:MAG: GNAT family N-acetyltransferase [Pseudomonadota bacterium]